MESFNKKLHRLIVTIYEVCYNLLTEKIIVVGAVIMREIEWETLSRDEKQKQLYLKQKELLDTFLEHHTISQEQYDKSLSDLTEKMSMQSVLSEIQE